MASVMFALAATAFHLSANASIKVSGWSAPLVTALGTT
jgi:hypothetical protein